MSKVRINFQDFAELLADCEYHYRFEPINSDPGEIRLRLFIDGKPSDYEMSIFCCHAEVAKEMTL